MRFLGTAEPAGSLDRETIPDTRRGSEMYDERDEVESGLKAMLAPVPPIEGPPAGRHANPDPPPVSPGVRDSHHLQTILIGGLAGFVVAAVLSVVVLVTTRDRNTTSESTSNRPGGFELDSRRGTSARVRGTGHGASRALRAGCVGGANPATPP